MTHAGRLAAALCLLSGIAGAAPDATPQRGPGAAPAAFADRLEAYCVTEPRRCAVGALPADLRAGCLDDLESCRRVLAPRQTGGPLQADDKAPGRASGRRWPLPAPPPAAVPIAGQEPAPETRESRFDLLCRTQPEACEVYRAHPQALRDRCAISPSLCAQDSGAAPPRRRR